MTDAALKLEDVPEKARPHFQKQLEDMTYNEKVAKRFHRWLRKETDLDRGTRRSYVDAAWEIFVNGEDPADVSDADAAIKKMKQMTGDVEKKSSEEDSQ